MPLCTVTTLSSKNSCQSTVLLPSSGGQRLTNISRNAERDLDPKRLFDSYYADWSKTQYYQSYDEKTSTLRMKPATPDLASFCSTEFSGCSADNTCPSFCGLSEQQRFNYSVRNMEICYMRYVEDMQGYFVDSAAAIAAAGKATVFPTSAWVTYLPHCDHDENALPSFGVLTTLLSIGIQGMSPRGYSTLYPLGDAFQSVIGTCTRCLRCETCTLCQLVLYNFVFDVMAEICRCILWV